MNRFVLAAATIALTCPTFGVAGDLESLRVGIPRSIFRDVPPALLRFANQPFKDIIKAQTGFDGEIVNEADALNIARDIDAGKVHLGVFLGHEFAWAKQRYPELEAMICSVPKPREIQAFILVRTDCPAANLGALKGKKLVLAAGTRDHARLFLDKRQTEEMTGESFRTIDKADTIHDALHTVIDGDADVTVADQASWRYFQRLYPGPSKNLRVLAESEIFPPTAIVFKKGKLTDEQLKKVREGLLTAHQTKKGERIMSIIKVEKFDTLPTNYENSLKACLKNYPIPKTDWAVDRR